MILAAGSSIGEELLADATKEPSSMVASLLGRLLKDQTILQSTMHFKGSPTSTIKSSCVEEHKDGTGFSEDPLRFVYVFQKEFATAKPETVKVVGTDEMTTCVGLALRNPESGVTSVGHLDFPNCVFEGMKQMVESVLPNENTILEVHLIGAYDDSIDSDNVLDEPKEYLQNHAGSGYSWPMAMKVVEALYCLPYNFSIQTFCILEHNTRVGDEGHLCPIHRGFVIETGTGQIMPANFTEDARGPDGVIRAISATMGPSSTLRTPYDTALDCFTIQPFKWEMRWVYYAHAVLDMSDEELLMNCSTSPYAESDSFVSTMRRQYKFICDHKHWQQAFPHLKPRCFLRSQCGCWMQQLDGMDVEHNYIGVMPRDLWV